MQQFITFLENIFGVIKGFGVTDFIDITIISFIIYKAFKIAKETRAEQLLKGIFLLLASYLVAELLNLKTLKFLLDNIITSGILALVVLFQPELRRILEKVGRSKVSNVFSINEKNTNSWEYAIPIIVESVDRLSKTNTGALIILEKNTKLGEQIATGIQINAQPSVELFGNIFFVNTPLHDGAVIMRNGRILAAACFLPKPLKEELIASHLGSRHRAAIGISEVSDSITIVISEETGTVSIAENGQLHRGFGHDRLTKYLTEQLISDDKEEKKKKSFPPFKNLKGGNSHEKD